MSISINLINGKLMIYYLIKSESIVSDSCGNKSYVVPIFFLIFTI